MDPNISKLDGKERRVCQEELTSLIEKRGVFIRETYNSQSQIIQKRFDGIIIDKFRGKDKSEYDRKIHIIDFYQVILDTGVVTSFACSELVGIIEPKENLNLNQ